MSLRASFLVGKYEGESYDEVVVHNALLPDGTRGDKVIKLGAPATKENMDAFRSSARLVSDNGSVLGLEAMKDLLSQDTMEVTAQLRKQVRMTPCTRFSLAIMTNLSSPSSPIEGFNKPLPTFSPSLV